MEKREGILRRKSALVEGEVKVFSSSLAHAASAALLEGKLRMTSSVWQELSPLSLLPNQTCTCSPQATTSGKILGAVPPAMPDRD